VYTNFTTRDREASVSLRRSLSGPATPLRDADRLSEPNWQRSGPLNKLAKRKGRSAATRLNSCTATVCPSEGWSRSERLKVPRSVKDAVNSVPSIKYDYHSLRCLAFEGAQSAAESSRRREREAGERLSSERQSAIWRLASLEASFGL